MEGDGDVGDDDEGVMEAHLEVLHDLPHVFDRHDEDAEEEKHGTGACPGQI